MEETNLMGGSFDKSKSARITELEKLVQEYHMKLEAAIATNTNQANSSLPETAASVKLLQSMTDDHSATFNQLSQEKQKLFESKTVSNVVAITRKIWMDLLTFFLKPLQPKICLRSRTRD